MIGLRTIRGRLLMGLSLTGAVVAAALAVSYVMFQRSDERWGRDVVGMRQSLQLSQRISGTIMREVVAGMQFLKTGKEEDSAAYTALMR